MGSERRSRPARGGDSAVRQPRGCHTRTAARQEERTKEPGAARPDAAAGGAVCSKRSLETRPNLVGMDQLDAALYRAHEIYLEDASDELDAELNRLIPLLLDAGYVNDRDWGDGWSLWSFTEVGIKRGEELGCL